MLLMKESVLGFEEKTTQHWVSYFPGGQSPSNLQSCINQTYPALDR